MVYSAVSCGIWTTRDEAAADYAGECSNYCRTAAARTYKIDQLHAVARALGMASMDCRSEGSLTVGSARRWTSNIRSRCRRMSFGQYHRATAE
jgi:hypothetical protein